MPPIMPGMPGMPPIGMPGMPGGRMGGGMGGRCGIGGGAMPPICAWRAAATAPIMGGGGGGIPVQHTQGVHFVSCGSVTGHHAGLAKRGPFGVHCVCVCVCLQQRQGMLW